MSEWVKVRAELTCQIKYVQFVSLIADHSSPRVQSRREMERMPLSLRSEFPSRVPFHCGVKLLVTVTIGDTQRDA